MGQCTPSTRGGFGKQQFLFAKLRLIVRCFSFHGHLTTASVLTPSLRKAHRAPDATTMGLAAFPGTSDSSLNFSEERALAAVGLPSSEADVPRCGCSTVVLHPGRPTRSTHVVMARRAL